MVSLIAAILAIGLLGALALLSWHFMGHVTLDASKSAQASTLVNESSQFAAAIIFYTVEHVGTTPTTFEDLQTSQYLNSVPLGWLDPVPGSTIASREINGAEATNVCAAFNLRYGIQGIPDCTSTGGITTPVCCQ
jgi:hypothetical protein